MTKGFILSFDALLALFVMFVLVLLSFSMFYFQENIYAEKQLSEFNNSVLTSLQVSGKLDRAVLRDNLDELRFEINSLPYEYCIELKVFDFNNNFLFVLPRQECNQVGEKVFVARRSLVLNENFDSKIFLAEQKLWVRE